MQDDSTTIETIPYGYCHCGCGEKTSVAKKSDARHGHVKGEPVRYIRFHQSSSPRRSDGKKKCTRCGDIIDRSLFRKDRRNLDGVSSYCKRCGAVLSGNYYRGNRDRVLDRCATYRKKNREKLAIRGKRYRQENPDKMREHHRNRRARKRDGFGNVSAKEWQNILDRFNSKCAKCGDSEDVTMDHVVPLAKGGKHSADNIQPLCRACNLQKFTKTEDYRGKLYRPLALPIDNDI